ncbi:DUF883 family protein [Aquipseudomonas campi]
MAVLSKRNTQKKALHSIETELEHLLSSIDSLKGEVGEESQKTLKALRAGAEKILGHSRNLLGDAYEEVKEKTVQAGIATRDYSREHPVAAASVAVGVVALVGYLLFRNRD